MTKKKLVDRDTIVVSRRGKRERIKKRQREGIDVALKNGIQLGRPKAEITDAFTSVYSEWRAGKITATEAMRRADMKRTTFYKLVKEFEEQQQQAN